MSNSSTESRLSSLAGLESAKRVVRRLAGGEAGVHAVLLYGAKGSGKTELAQTLAEAWMCRNPSSDGACGECQSCGAVKRGSNPDLYDIYPQPPSNIIRLPFISPKANPEKDDPIPLRDYLRTGPLMSSSKVAIIHDAHRMNRDASHALLKTLEEPPDYGRIVLTTDSVGGVLPTVLSRCLSIACELPKPESVLALSNDATDDDLRLAEGTPGRLKIVLAHRSEYRRIAIFARTLITLKPGEALKAAEEFRSIAEAIEKGTGCGARAANTEALDMLAAFLARESSVDPRWTQYVVEAHRRIQNNGQAPLVFDALFTRLLRRLPIQR